MLSSVSLEAQDAIRHAVKLEESVHELALVGVPERVLSLLDEAGIVYLEQLISMNPDEVAHLKSLGQKSVEVLVEGLQDYHLVAPIRAKHDKEFVRKVQSYGRPRWCGEESVTQEDFEDDA